MKNPLTIHSDASESLHYNIDTFPLYTHKDELKNYDYKALVHWHPDLEYIYIVDGTMDYFVNGEIVTIKKGNGIFVNSQRLHYGFSEEKNECTFIALVISPDIFVNINHLCEDYFGRKFGLKNEDYILLDKNTGWMKECLDGIVNIHELMHEENTDVLGVIARSIDLINTTGKHIENEETNTLDSHDQLIFLDLSEYISKNYKDKITIDILSRHAGISRNKCCELFRKYSNDTPMDYLTRYRIDKSVELLRNTHLPITDISVMCGFNSPSYFTNVFTKIRKTKPKNIRNLNSTGKRS